MTARATGAGRRAGRLIAVLMIGAVPIIVWGWVWGVPRWRARHDPAHAGAAVPDRAPGLDADAGDAGAGPSLAEVAALVRRARGNPGLLIDAFAAWARDPAALPARRIVLGALAAEPQPATRLAALLAAAEASPFPAGEDPLHREMTAAMSALWQGRMMRQGRDLIFAEARPKARDLVISSFIDLALSDRGAALDESQRYGLASDFVDLYSQAAPARRSDILAVVRKLGGSDTAEVLQGHGLSEESLERHRRALEAARRASAAASATERR